ncbi:MAG: p-aminobenzyol-glutamate (AbgT) family transporter [Idiomarinaceae bacterium HL-53]|nr:MAG: p-aminobenzyol-glutamate (AbgT) family transporter [Idiomarinaceae bacterium HL-53]CUS48708.1 aminobenzoyl-glutamate transport protein [Idiomarinaceae bacterium HL-53]
MSQNNTQADNQTGLLNRILNKVEVIGNKLPDPAVMFAGLLVIVWILSLIFSQFSYAEADPRTGVPIVVNNLLAPDALAQFLASMVTTFTSFAPLGVVLVAMLGIGVAERSGFINVAIKLLLNNTAKFLLTPLLILVAIVSHTAVDAGYVLVIPLGGIIFYAAGRHPLAGIAAAFAGVSGGFSANFVPSAIDPMLQGITQTAAQLYDPNIVLNPLNNWMFTGLSSIVVVLVGWYITDKVVEPRLKGVMIDGDKDDMPQMEEVSAQDRKAFHAGGLTMLLGIGLLIAAVWPETSALRSPAGEIAAFDAPLMQSIVPLIFLLFWVPGIVHGYVSGTFKESKDIIMAMSKTMETMAYYLVMAFFCALFIKAFGDSNLGILIAMKGANFLGGLGVPGPVTLVGIILLVAVINLFVGSASAKWLLISPIFVPMLMQLGISPDLTQAAYRVGDSVSNIITPLLPYFPLVVVYCQRYVKNTGIGTLVSMMLPFSVTLLIVWTAFLLIYWGIGLPLGVQSNYLYPAG